jgi:hypothetical protein
LGSLKVGVVIPVMNQFELAIKALHSFRLPQEIIWQPFIINNWDQNNGVAHAWNVGSQKAIQSGCDYIFILNDDIVLAPHTPQHLINLLADEEIGVITGTDHRASHTPEQVFDMQYPNYEVEFLDAPDFACFALTPKSYSHIGLFDENLHPAYFEDNDYCYRTILSGLKCIRSQNAAFYHHGSQTQNSGEPVVPSPLFEKNRDYYIRKWGGEPGSEIHTHPWNNWSLSWTDITL